MNKTLYVTSGSITDRGYTFHEHLYAFNLINMNGRVYDPIVGRMLSPDNFIQAPGFSQSLNRYSYCWNNPLKYTDPSGQELGVENNRKFFWWANRGSSNSSYGIGPGSNNHWSDPYRDKDGDFMLMTSRVFDNKHGHGAWDNYFKEWDKHAGFEVNRKYTDNGVEISYSGGWVSHSTSYYGSESEEGGVTFEQAKIWYQFGGGRRMDVSLNSIDLSKVRISDFNSRGLVTVRLDGKYFSNLNDALVHGTITLQRIGNTNQARVALNTDPTTPQINGQPAGMYNFTMHSWGEPISWIRNPLTFMGGIFNGLMPVGGTFIYVGGTPFPIYYNGTTTIQP